MIVVLNGVPRSGKTSIAAALEATKPEAWTNIGVDSMMSSTPAELLPGIGLRPGGERPDIEAHIPLLYERLCADVVGAAASGMNVAVDVGLHEGHSRPLGVVGAVAGAMGQCGALFVGVRCQLNEIMRRRDASTDGGATYVQSNPDGTIPDQVLAWEQFVHDPGVYDIEVDTSVDSAHECAMQILERLASQEPPTAFGLVAAGYRPSKGSA